MQYKRTGGRGQYSSAGGESSFRAITEEDARCMREHTEPYRVLAMGVDEAMRRFYRFIDAGCRCGQPVKLELAGSPEQPFGPLPTC